MITSFEFVANWLRAHFDDLSVRFSPVISQLVDLFLVLFKPSFCQLICLPNPFLILLIIPDLTKTDDSKRNQNRNGQT